MNNLILRFLSAENYTAFAETVQFTTQIINGKREFPENTFYCGDEQFSRVNAVYGANGSGKTFFCKILKEIQRLLMWSPLSIADSSQLSSIPAFASLEQPVKTFAFDTAYQLKPTKFCIEIILHETTYHYEFSILNRTVIYELLTKKRRRREVLLERTSPSFKDITLRSDLKSFDATKHVVKENALCLSIAGLLNNPLANEIVTAIQSIEVVSMTGTKLRPFNPTEMFSDDRLQKYIQVMQKADPTIREISVDFEEEEIAHQPVMADDFENRELIAKKLKVNVTSRHAIYDNGEETLGTPIAFFTEESLGTVKLFTTLPYLYDALEHGGVLVVDELENGLHLSLAQEIISLFQNEATNPLHAQLIFTSHQPLLVANNFRRDQVWMVSKDSLGKSTMHRMSDLKISRAKSNLATKLMDNAFGCTLSQFFPAD